MDGIAGMEPRARHQWWYVMEITKTVPVTIEVDDDNKRDCSGGCCFNVEGRYCARFDVTTINGRNDGCLSEFGTSEPETKRCAECLSHQPINATGDKP